MEEDVQIVMFVPVASPEAWRRVSVALRGGERCVFVCLQCPETFFAQLLR
jgi:predicted phosphoribosyltransferase